MDDPITLIPFDRKLHKPRQNKDGSVSTELTITTDGPTGGFWNIPSIWYNQNGEPVELDQKTATQTAVEYERATGRKFRRFGTIAAAEKFATARSKMGGGTVGSITTGPYPAEESQVDDLNKSYREIGDEIMASEGKSRQRAQ